jgi:DNA invertase Pin-like site-specific DNA recombinase
MEKLKAIIYLRKSTDRDDKQQISVEAQRQYCEKLAKDYGFEPKIIEDYKSAKEEGKRP